MIATGGIDLSVGSVMAISGAVACLLISDLGDQNAVGSVLLIIGVAIAASLVLGLWNGRAGGVRRHPADHRDADPDGGRPWCRPVDHRRSDHQLVSHAPLATGFLPGRAGRLPDPGGGRRLDCTLMI
ncbi:hypothetical protein [Actinoplanes derwentensis]|uniref:hypothetical protein n=1 Tax=Actinoplanes derwentensis TaxID=113562 RepID=UPI002F9096DB